MHAEPVKVIRNEPGIMVAQVGYDIADVANALNGVDHVMLTQGHPEFGIECTVARGDEYATVINQPSPIAAIIAGRKALDSLTTMEDTP